MSFQSLGQELIVVEQSPSMHGHFVHPTAQEPLEVSNDFNEHAIEVGEPIEIELIVEDIPGAPPGTHDPELEVSEDSDEEDEEPEEEVKLDENEAKKAANNEKWNWSSKGADGFIPWVKDRLDSIPKHSGMDTAGIERAISYMDRLDGEISKAMRLDIDGDLDANKIEDVRSKIDDGLDRLHDRLDKIKKSKKIKRKKTATDETGERLIKEAQKITGVQGTFVTVPLAVSAIARICVNGVVSAGKNLDDLFFKLAAKYDLTQREQSEVAWLLQDMGFPLRGDRGFFPDEEVDVESSDNYEWIANYPG